MANEDPRLDTVELATELTIAWLGNPNTRASTEEVPAFLNKMHEAVKALAGGQDIGQGEAEQPGELFEPATTVRKSLASKDHIISMIDGKPYKALRRHLAKHGLTPAEYRSRYNLKGDYPMVAPNYSEVRRSMAQKIGLGRKPRNKGANAATAPAKGASRGRRGETAGSNRVSARRLPIGLDGRWCRHCASEACICHDGRRSQGVNLQTICASPCRSKHKQGLEQALARL